MQLQPHLELQLPKKNPIVEVGSGRHYKVVDENLYLDVKL